MSDAPTRSRPASLKARWLLAVSLMAAGGCSTVLPLFIGKPKDTPAPASATPPAPTTAFNWNSSNWAGEVFGGHDAILPPTVPDDSPPLVPAAPVAIRTEPRKPIATAALIADPGALTPFAEAAQRASAADPGSHFVLLVLTPPAASTPAIGQLSTSAQASANAAAQTLAKAGIGADRLAISGATSADVGAGELRLYVR